MKARLLSICWFTLAISLTSSAQVTQEWARRYNGPANLRDEVTGLVVDSHGNACVTGWTEHGTGPDVQNAVTIKYDPAGTTLWTAMYNDPPYNGTVTSGIALDSADNVFVTGTYSAGGYDVDCITIKYSPAGRQLWAAIYDTSSWDQGLFIAVDHSGCAIVAGTAADEDSLKIFILKYNTLGVLQWTAFYHVITYVSETITDMAVDTQGNVYLCATLPGGPSGYYDILTMKCSATGIFQWKAWYGASTSGTNARALAVDPDGNVYVTGVLSSTPWTSAEIAIIKYDPSGHQLWETSFNQDFVEPWDLALDGSNNVLVTGMIVDGTVGWWDFLTLKYNAHGAFQWQARYSTPGNPDCEVPYCIVTDDQDCAYVTGYSQYWGAPINQHWWTTIKYDSNGNLMWHQATRFRDPTCSPPVGLAVDAHGNVYLAGYTGPYDPGLQSCLWDYITVKYRQNETEAFMGQNSTAEADQGASFTLENPSPNPFNPSTAISFELRASSYVSLKVYDTMGRLVETLVEGWREAGEHQATFDGSGLPSGVYLYRVKAGTWSETGKMILLK